jgi:hypothetical protein
MAATNVLYADWLEHGMAAIREVREERPSDYLKVIALLVSKSEGVTVVNTHFHEMEQFIEERRQKALLEIAKMRAEPEPPERP